VRHSVWSMAAVLLTLAVAGCGGSGQTLTMSFDMDAVPAPAKVQQALRVTVVPFEDVRSDKTSIGRYQHYVETTVDTLVPAQGSAADQITRFVAEYLKRAGFQVSLAKAGETVPAGSADVVLTGQIESYWNEAVARFFRTELTSKNRLVIKVSNAADASMVRSTVTGSGSRTAVFFDLPDLERLNSEALGEALSRLLGGVDAVNRTLKPKQ
jgi:hypothetical protein